jgi:hypothetical protein
MRIYALCGLLTIASPAHAQSAGSSVAGVPGAIWIDRDADGKVDGYLLDGQVHVGAPSPPAQSGLTSANPAMYSEWGDWGRLDGTIWKDSDGTIYSYAWDKPGQVLTVQKVTADDSVTRRFTKRADGKIAVSNGLGTITLVRPGYAVQEYARTRVEYWFSDEAITTTVSSKLFKDYEIIANSKRVKATQADLTTALQRYQAAIAARNVRSSGGGLGSILGAAAMGAIMGGGGQNSVDLAVAGAQAAAQGGNPLDVLNSMGSVAAANAAESKRQLDETITRAQGGNSLAASTSYSTATSSPAGPATSRPAMTKKAMQVYFWVGTTPTVDDGHNTHCQSNVFSVTIDWDPNLEASGGNLRYANAVLDPMKSTFIDKCNRAGNPVTDIADWYADAFSGWHLPAPLRRGDTEVQMP